MILSFKWLPCTCVYAHVVPRYGPRVTNVTRLSGDSVEVSWVPLSREEARGVITEYTVTAQPANTQRREERTVIVSVPPSESMTVVEGLDQKLAYWVSVSASTAAGTSTNNSRVFVAKFQLGERLCCLLKALPLLACIPTGINPRPGNTPVLIIIAIAVICLMVIVATLLIVITLIVR